MSWVFRGENTTAANIVEAPPVPPPPRFVDLRMTYEDAAALLSLVGQIGGGNATGCGVVGIRAATERLGCALTKAGVKKSVTDNIWESYNGAPYLKAV